MVAMSLLSVIFSKPIIQFSMFRQELTQMHNLKLN